MTKTMKIQGMHCAGCSSNLQRMLGKQPGVTTAVVDLESATAVVEYDEGAITPKRLAQVVDDCGFAVVE